MKKNTAVETINLKETNLNSLVPKTTYELVDAPIDIKAHPVQKGKIKIEKTVNIKVKKINLVHVDKTRKKIYFLAKNTRESGFEQKKPLYAASICVN
jgi:hypothetical protein